MLIGNIGKKLFAIRSGSVEGLSSENVHLRVVSHLTQEHLYGRARRAPQKPSVREVTRTEYIRSADVVAATLRRAAGRCEMPSCQAELFQREDGTLYLEIHHVVPLAENGLDSTENTAALCPRCHREQHFGAKRLALRKKLATHIKAMHPAF